ncbi:Anucleate primary sterigmata protein A [Penicillium verhagenii]|uniref:Anucleate primary sterigmata protein A n=1 Tax=Penicillium verhagenii TaxID=1562060 RepID=UPI0025450BF7|nr:Anucleate primary sterigmata protein A [Penicillium verhagenii]KAJ5947862.1 Anucleate primary sterigmata protein A [Penicillium verhagenii]
MTAPDAGANTSFTSMMEDPFVSNSAREFASPNESHQFSSFDTQLFNINASSPAQAKRALAARLAETERQLEETSKVGTALIEQQRQLEEYLKTLEQQKDEGEMSPELRQKLTDLERDYAEIERDTTRAILAPKRLAGGSEEGHFGTPGFEVKSPISPALFAGQATNSPSKVGVPSRKQRNQPSGRVHDIEFATEISTSLLGQVRQLQGLLAERDESIKTINLEKSRLELEAEGYSQRIRVLDDSEQRYKDENWALETQTHELLASVRESAEREKRLTTTLSASNAEKTAVERELEELRQSNSKLLEEHDMIQKANDSEFHLLRRNLNASDLEKSALHKKMEELNLQNQELAKAVAMRIREYESQGNRDLQDDNEDDEPEETTPDNSPPPSPNKFTPRHGHLESETLKSSLGHAHRMIQNLKSTIHREKTEKIELKRMLQEARDEVEQRRRETAAPNGGANKRLKKKEESFRKPARPDLLGAGRKEKSHVELHELHDTDWEDNAGQLSPTRSAIGTSVRGHSGHESPDEPSDVYQTATEAEDGFETANERATATESEAFQTGVESMADDSSDSADLTETENNVQTTPRQRVSSSLVMAKSRERNSYHSSASTSDDDDDQDGGYPSPSQIHISRPRVKSKRSVLRRIRPSGEAPMASSSRPSSARNSASSSFEQEPMAQGGQSLFAELAELEGGEEDEEEETGELSPASTPRMGPTLSSRRPSDAMLDLPPRPVMVDSGVMTDPWEPSAQAGVAAIGGAAVGAVVGAVASDLPTTPKKNVTTGDREIAIEDQEASRLVSSGTQATPVKPSTINGDHLSNVSTPPNMVWDERSIGIQQVEAGTQAEPELVELGMATIASQETFPALPTWPELRVAYFSGGATEPVLHTIPVPELPELNVSLISSQCTEPMQHISPAPKLPELNLSFIASQSTEPIEHIAPMPKFPELNFSSVASQYTEPVEHIAPVPELPEVNFSSISSQSTEPVVAKIPEPQPIIPVEPMRKLPEPSLSSLFSYSTEPVQPQLPEPQTTPEPVPIPVAEEVPVPEVGMSSISSQHTEPIVPILPEPVPEPESVVKELSLPELGISLINSLHTEPIVARLPVPAPVPEPSQLEISWLDPSFTVPVTPKQVEVTPQILPSFAILRSVETEPVDHVPFEVPPPPISSFVSLRSIETEPVKHVPFEVPQPPVSSFVSLRSIETEPMKSLPRVVPSMAEFGMQTEPTEDPKAAYAAVVVYEDEPSEAARGHATEERRASTGLALNDMTGNSLERQAISSVNTDQGSQTILSSKQIDQILMDRESTRPISSSDSKYSREMAAVTAASPFATPKLRPRPHHQSSAKSSASIRRPDTATSQISSSSAHPPLPSDHREAILAAEKKSIDVPPASPGVMGPPLAPASAYRVNAQTAPRTPNEQNTRAGSARTVSTQPRMRRGSQSQMSRRSSVSSFASELEERFNMATQAGPMPNGYGPNTDPRMIQAITQTMIGEFLWKYTRKTGSSDMSTTRHRRYFWVHPYTRTLYWSEKDPQTAGKSELRTKSIPIEAVRVVADDNPYPPGLHCRSLEVVGPGRRLRFTASTSQRHETWYNALTYLLTREDNGHCEDHDSVTLDDIDEFNPGFRSGSRQTARMSLSSYNSRTLRPPPKRATSAMSMRSTGTPGRASPALSSPVPNSSLQVPEERQRSSSRLSTILTSSIRGSIASMKGRNGQASSTHEGSIRGQDSIEDFGHHSHSHVDDEDRLENVRACCDGKHDVGSLSRTSRYSPRVDRSHSHHH